MVIGLASQLEVPLRERNELLIAAGYAPEYRQLAYEDPDLAPVREAIEQVLAAHDPYPALVVDRHWELVAANSGLGVLTDGVASHLLEPPANALRISMHPEGMAPRILNLGEWRSHTLHRLERQMRLTGDAAIAGLLEELASYPGPDGPGVGTRTTSSCRCGCAARRTKSCVSSARSRPSAPPSTSPSPSSRSSRSSQPTTRPPQPYPRGNRRGYSRRAVWPR